MKKLKLDNCVGKNKDKRGGATGLLSDGSATPAVVEGKEDAKLEMGRGPDECGGGGGEKRKMSFIAVHLGAGEHSVKRKAQYKLLCDMACSKGMRILREGGSAGDAVAEAIKCLEDSGIVNAGSGSNLTLEGTVECDAGYMDGDGYFGGVGGVPDVPNPIVVAKAIADVHKKEKLFSFHRVPPNFMIGSAAKLWAASEGIPTCEDRALISKRATKTYKKYMTRLQPVTKDVNDTVGAIALDCSGEVASGVSSGGNWLKYPGRIGHSPLFACGCYCCNQSPVSSNSIAVSSSGSGEMLSRVRLPQECACEANNESSFGLVGSLITCINERFLNNATLDIHSEPRLLGLIALSWNGSQGEFAWAHTSKNLVVAYSSSKMRSTKMHFSELGKDSSPGKSLKAEGICF